MYQILPFIEQGNVQNIVNGATVNSTIVPTYTCPTSRAPSLDNGIFKADYAGCSGTVYTSNGDGILIHTSIKSENGTSLFAYPLITIASVSRWHLEHADGERKMVESEVARKQP